ncbi:hypothetical protein JTE90_028661 [Oedothorax gibbosus]|uniref:Ribosomal protein n=1 Tax=Oedothorax gibbosus TaxID=931172 RepID=A0AAV6UZJ3_9ARAC|nr:hypothetical protein JTE90_028661 [Oedothorax gibbosus]
MQHIKLIRNFIRTTITTTRSYCLTTNLNKLLRSRQCEAMCTPTHLLPDLVPTRGFKDKDVLTKRCKDCYFTKQDGRWYVLCHTHPRHKQRQRWNEKDHWIITHETHGKKKF